MIPSPYLFEPEISDQDLARLGILMLRWSHIEHTLGNGLMTLLRLSDEEAIVMVFPLSLEQRSQRITQIAKIAPLNSHAQTAFTELKALMKGLQFVTNSVAHSIVREDDDEGHVFHLKSKRTTLTKAQIFSVDELTNYAAHLVVAFRYALGFKNGAEPMFIEWPPRPEIPDFLRSKIQFAKA